MNEKVVVDKNVVPAVGESVRYLTLSLEAPEAERRNERRAVNLALVLDRSGSMHGKKLERAQDAARQVVRVLGPGDRFSTVAYSDEAQILTSSRAATPEARTQADVALAGLEANGNTNLSEGWFRGCEQVALALGDAQLGRCLLLTDGLANRGIVSQTELVRHAGALRERRIATSTFGVGTDFNEVLLRQMAEAGGGNFYFIEEAAQIPTFIRGEVDDALEITARDVSLRIRAPEGVRIVSLNEFPMQREGADWRFELGSLVSRQVLEPVFEVHVPAGQEGSEIVLAMRIVDRDGAMTTEPLVLSLRRVSAAEHAAAPGDPEVLRRAARLRAALASQAALEHNRQGLRNEARQRLLDEANALEQASPGDEQVQALANDLRRKAQEFGEDMDAFSRKQYYFESYRSLKGRAMSGRALRRDDPASIVPTPGPARAAAILAGGLLLASASDGAARVVERAARSLLPVASALGGIALNTGLLRIDGKAKGFLMKADEEALVRRARRLAASIRMVVTEQGLDDNWFSHWHWGGRVALVSLHGWESTAKVPPEAFIAYEALLFGLYNRSADYDHKALLHQETRACIFDFCVMKSEIEIKLQTADLCAVCSASLARMSIDPKSLRPYCETIRSLARPR